MLTVTILSILGLGSGSFNGSSSENLFREAALAGLPLILLTGAGKPFTALAVLTTLAVVQCAALLPAGTLPDSFAAIAATLALVLRKVMYIAFPGMLLLTTIEVGDLVRSLEKTGLPWSVILPLAVCVRVLPSMWREGGQIIDAMRLRGLLSLGKILRHPMGTLELILMTLLFRAMAMGEELAWSASTRAVSGGRRAWYRDLTLTISDLAFFVLVLGSASLIAAIP